MRRTPLESWISEMIFGCPGRVLTEEDIRRYQLAKLRQTIDYAAERSSFYRKRLAGLSGKDLQRLEHLSAFPFTTMEDLQENGPQLLCVSQSQVERVVTLQLPDSSEKPRRVYFSEQDLERTIDFFHHGMTTLVNPSQRVLILMPGDRPGSVGDLLARALARARVEGFIHGVVQDPEETIHEIVDHQIDCLVGIPTQVLALARHETGDEIPEGRIKGVLLSADYVPSTIVKELGRVWNCPVFSHYGTTEMGLGGAVDCEAFSGYHVREADLLLEIVDPASGGPQPAGEPGEIVFTTLTRNAMPLIRYRTGDLSEYLPDRCACGTVLRRLGKVRGKVRETVLLRSGDWLGIEDLDEALFGIPGIMNYLPSVIRAGDPDRLEIAIYAASHSDQSLSERVLRALSSVPPIAHAVEAGHLILDPIQYTTEDWITTGVAKRSIVQRNEKE